MSLAKKCAAELFGTFWLVFGGCGSAVFAAAFPNVGIGLLGVSLAFGLTVMTMAYAIGHVSGCHLNPAVSIGLVVGKRFSSKELGPYIVAQVAGGLLAALLLHVLLSGKEGFSLAASGLASNGFGEHSPGHFGMVAGLLGEIVLTAFFLLIILGATDERAPKGFAPLPIGLGLTLIHLIGIPLTNLSVNPARSTGPALVSTVVGNSETWALGQVWLFWVGPIVGAVLGALAYTAFATADAEAKAKADTRK
jgi:aquaporin Z